MLDLDYVDSTYFPCFWTYMVEKVEYFLFVGYRHIESAKVWIGVDNLLQVVNLRNFEVFIHCVYAFVLKLLVEVTDRERMS